MLWLQIQNVTVQMFFGKTLSAVWVIFHMQLTAHVIVHLEYVLNVLGNKPQNHKKDKLKVKLTSQADGISSSFFFFVCFLGPYHFQEQNNENNHLLKS